MVAAANPIAEMATRCDAIAVAAMQIEADARSGMALLPDQLAEFAKAIREFSESMGTMMRTILTAVDQGQI